LRGKQWYTPKKSIREFLEQEITINDPTNDDLIDLPPLLNSYLNTGKLPLEGEWFENEFGHYKSPVHDRIHE
jgi:hypothetical protein